MSPLFLETFFWTELLVLAFAMAVLLVAVI